MNGRSAPILGSDNANRSDPKKENINYDIIFFYLLFFIQMVRMI